MAEQADIAKRFLDARERFGIGPGSSPLVGKSCRLIVGEEARQHVVEGVVTSTDMCLRTTTFFIDGGLWRVCCEGVYNIDMWNVCIVDSEHCNIKDVSGFVRLK